MGNLKRWRLVLPKSMKSSIFLGTFAAGSGVALLAVSAWLIVRASQSPPILTLQVAIVAVRFFGLARPVGRYFERLVSHDAVLRQLAKVRGQIVDSLSNISPNNLLLASRGKLLARLVADVDRTQDLFLRIVSPVISGFLLLGIGSGISAFILPTAGLATFLLLVVATILSMILAYFASRDAVVDRSPLFASVNELVRGAEELHMWKARSRELERTLALDREVTEKEAFAVRGFGLGSLAIFVGVGLVLMEVIPLATDAYRSQEVAWASMAVLILVPLAMLEVLLPIPTAVSLLPATLASLDSTRDVLESNVAMPEAHIAAIPTPKLEAQGISFGWTNARDQICDYSLEISYGTKLGIVGESGSGKTTLALLLSGLLTPDRGRVLLNGIDLRAMSDQDRAAHITFAAQDSYLFDTSIRENLLIARSDATDYEMYDVLKRVGLYEWVSRYDLGIDHQIGENGTFLSGGQRRRLIVAQALLSRAPIKIFDEPTAHLDLYSANRLMAEILKEPGTVVVISHLVEPLKSVARVELSPALQSLHRYN